MFIISNFLKYCCFQMKIFTDMYNDYIIAYRIKLDVFPCFNADRYNILVFFYFNYHHIIFPCFLTPPEYYLHIPVESVMWDSCPRPLSSFNSPCMLFSKGYLPLKSKKSLAPRIAPSQPSGLYFFCIISGMYSLRCWNVYSASENKIIFHHQGNVLFTLLK